MFVSRTLSRIERKYSQTKREALGLVWACKRLHMYIYGATFILVTDHKPLLWIYGNSRKTPPARVLRWAVRLQGYDYKVQYIQGKRNPSDILSRQPTPTHQGHNQIEQSIKHIIAHAVPKAVSLQDIISEANKDRLFQNVIECVNTGQWKKTSEMRPFWEIRDELTHKNGLLLRDTRLVIPSTLRSQILGIVHETHLGITKSKELLRTKAWWPGMGRSIEQQL